MSNELLAAIITGFVTIVGLMVSNYYIKKKEDRTKRLQLRIEYISEQIEEFYGPLYSLIQQIKNYKIVREAIITPVGLNQNDVDKIRFFFRENYYSTLNFQIRELIKNKFHLIEGKELPKSFWAYLKHSTQLSVQIQLWKELHIDTQNAKGVPWPDEFEIDVKSTLDKLMVTYDSLLKELE